MLIWLEKIFCKNPYSYFDSTLQNHNFVACIIKMARDVITEV